MLDNRKILNNKPDIADFAIVSNLKNITINNLK